ncbi:MAG: SDR family NAD(P)-dependent oxidoreductase [Erythrobacter sp.]|jgi:short-subunit dehydrogenase|nr:SDR family NAD(P)-dependent oxidoreductase [Erythrobacter sp.]
MSKKPINKLTGLCVVTGASSGIGFELAKLAAGDGCDLLLVADRDLTRAEREAENHGAASVSTLLCDLATRRGIDQVIAAIGGREVDVLMANAGEGEGGAFLEMPWELSRRTIETNILGTCALVHRIGSSMLARNHGRILVTGSIAGHMPGAFNLTYNSTKAFLNDFCVGLANELRESRVVVSCLEPGGTQTEFFKHADMEDTGLAAASTADPAKVARDGYQALLAGEVEIVSGLMNKLLAASADLLPDTLIAEIHRRLAKS